MPDFLFTMLENVPEDTTICTSGRIAIVSFGNIFDASNFNGKYDILSTFIMSILGQRKSAGRQKTTYESITIIVSFI